ncbi:unnamed protein product [Hydatigera taeniaeformis]|uniref:Fibronectin type-III domain-containing protein n=1 Tax=Hydatigena taeniaeformis TaxID=6205 RepID=A0A0R3X861_HYDTA|nr:unnamed protein product [Hydatigera taeniaeformis]
MSVVVPPTKQRCAEGIPLLPPFFTWSYVGPHRIVLSWDVERLGVQYADWMRLTAEEIPTLNIVLNSTLFVKGSLILEGLKPDTTYIVTAEGRKVAGIVFSSTEVITTPSNGCLDAEFAPFAIQSRLRNDNVTLHA